MVKVEGGSINLPAKEKDKNFLENVFEPFIEIANIFIPSKNENIQIRDLYVGKFLVTQREWQLIMGNNPSHFKGAPGFFRGSPSDRHSHS